MKTKIIACIACGCVALHAQTLTPDLKAVPKGTGWKGNIAATKLVEKDMPAPELLEEVRQAYADDLVDPSVADLEGIERDIAEPKPWRHDRHTLITDVIDEMEWWAAFHLEDSRSMKAPVPELPPKALSPAPTGHAASQPFVREPKIGRNDPCPCGSGKKYKKCCGATK